MKQAVPKALLCALLMLTFVCAVRAADPINDISEGRPITDPQELRYWLANMNAHHFTAEEVGLSLGLSTNAAGALIDSSHSDAEFAATSFDPPNAGQIVVLPYPGGRHPRIGFLEGAVRPQRETKISVFAPWQDGGYLVVDLPEAVWHHQDGKRQLLYLAHTHVPTIWDKQGVRLPRQEWDRDAKTGLSLTREFPNKVAMTSRAKVADGGVRLEFRVTNHSTAPLTGLHIQMCGMLKGLTGFAEQTNDNKVFSAPFATCRNSRGNRWVVLGFDHCVRAWGNARCPCLHADPQVPDCAPGETQIVHGWVSFFEGEEIAGELQRLEKVAFEPMLDP